MDNRLIKSNQNTFIIRKAEKLTTAVYLITDFFDNRESLKWELRAKALSFLSLTRTLFCKYDGEATKNNSRALIEEILTFLDLARNGFLVSPMNLSILREEYQLLLGVMLAEMRRKGSFDDFEFPEKFFAEPHEAHSFASAQTKDKNIQSDKSIKDTNIEHAGLLSNELNIYGENILKYKKDIRRETILKMLRAKGEITVKDISYLMRGVSEKTLQRELLAMVDEGILAKEGERRWSKYLLKT